MKFNSHFESEIDIQFELREIKSFSNLKSNRIEFKDVSVEDTVNYADNRELDNEWT